MHSLTGPVHRSSLLVWPSPNPELSEWVDQVMPTTPQRDPPRSDGRDCTGRGEWRPVESSCGRADSKNGSAPKAGTPRDETEKAIPRESGTEAQIHIAYDGLSPLAQGGRRG